MARAGDLEPLTTVQFMLSLLQCRNQQVAPILDLFSHHLNGGLRSLSASTLVTLREALSRCKYWTPPQDLLLGITHNLEMKQGAGATEN